MIHKIGFSNIYNFHDAVEIDFDSSSNLYVIFGDNCSGKSNLLSIIEIISHVFWDKPNYQHLHKIINRDSDSSLITMSLEFTFEQTRYSFYGEIDLKYECFVRQSFKHSSSSKYLYQWNMDQITSDYFSSNQLKLIRTFKYKQHGLFPYINALADGNHIEELKVIRKLATKQDYIDLDLIFKNENSLVQIANALKCLEPDLQKVTVLESQVTQQKVQGTPVELSNPNIRHSLDLVIMFHYPGYDLPLNQHSTGFIKLFTLCVEYLATYQELFFQPRIIDNMTAYLNDDLLEQVLAYFNNNYRRQLVFTSYNQIILEKKLLPKESIILIDKATTNSTVTKLSKFKNLRNDQRHNWRKMYQKNILNMGN